MGQFEILRIGRIPIYVDFFFVLLAFMWSWQFWVGGSSVGMSAGFVLVIGLFASILLHELGHAWSGQWFGIGTRAIELNGLGGLCHFDRSLPASVVPRTVVGLAGPFANLVLWLVFEVAADWARGAGGGILGFVLGQLAYVNWLLLIFNLLPAFPLDGGRVLEAWLSPAAGALWATRIVAVLGLLVCFWLAMYGLRTNGIFIMLLAVLLGLHNWQMLQSAGGIGRR